MMANFTDHPGFHRHKCYFCGWVWEHDDENDKAHGDSGAHECQSCGRCNWGLGIYTGDEQPSRVVEAE